MKRFEVEQGVQCLFAKKGIDVQAWPWWRWIDVIVKYEMTKMQQAVNSNTEDDR